MKGIKNVIRQGLTFAPLSCHWPRQYFINIYFFGGKIFSATVPDLCPFVNTYCINRSIHPSIHFLQCIQAQILHKSATFRNW